MHWHKLHTTHQNNGQPPPTTLPHHKHLVLCHFMLCVCVLWTPHKPMATTTTGHAHHQPCLTTTTNNNINTFVATSCGGDEGVLRVVWQNTTPHMPHTPHEHGVQVQHTQTTMLLAGFTQQTNNAIHKWPPGAMQCSAAMVVVVCDAVQQHQLVVCCVSALVPHCLCSCHHIGCMVLMLGCALLCVCTFSLPAHKQPQCWQCCVCQA